MDDSDDQNTTSNNLDDEITRELSESDSASCNSISNPYYDGPKKEEGRSSCEVQGPSTIYRQLGETNDMVIVTFSLGYFKTCIGFLRLLQLILTLATLICLVSSGQREGGLLLLPLEWHFRIMLFVLVLTLMTSIVIIAANVTSVINVLVVEWTVVDMVLYSVFAFLYLVATSLVASAFDFYRKMQTNVSERTVHQLAIVVIMGYVCMVMYGLMAILSYRFWRMQYRLYQRRKLLEEDEIDL